ncbi:protein of unknown function [Tepidibacter aestuarii]|nr:protein of unknown function [Tepidibacter aestuarii]
MCDELSVVIYALADDSTETPILFAAKEGLATDKPIGFTLKNV